METTIKSISSVHSQSKKGGEPQTIEQAAEIGDGDRQVDDENPEYIMGKTEKISWSVQRVRRENITHM